MTIDAARDGETVLTFWFEFASTYTYLTLQRAPAAFEAADLETAGVRIVWRPFLLGPIFAAQGWDTSPFNLYPAKGAFMRRDVARRAEALGLPFALGSKFPVNSVAAAKLALAALETPQGPAFCQRVSRAVWAENRNIESATVLAGLAFDVGLSHDALLARAEAMKGALRRNVEDAMAAGVMGAPSFTVEAEGARELFWGDDQLEDAIAWAKARAAGAPGALAPRPTV